MSLLSLIDYKIIDCSCLVPIRGFPSPSRSIHFGEVSEANGREAASQLRLDQVTRNALAARNNET